MAYNNTYGLKLIDHKTYEKILELYSAPKKGCLDLMLKCRAAGDKYDPKAFGINPAVNELCLAATVACGKVGAASQGNSGRSAFDIAHKLPDPAPPSYCLQYFNQAWVQKELGARVNFTGNSLVVENDIVATAGDTFRREGMKDVEFLLANGVKVALGYGDRDMRCPWLGGENLSLKANWTGAEEFRTAGYEYLRTNSKYQGGVVRQHGNLSFARIFEAGHDSELPTFKFPIIFKNSPPSSRLVSTRDRSADLQPGDLQHRHCNRKAANIWVVQQLHHHGPTQQLWDQG